MLQPAIISKPFTAENAKNQRRDARKLSLPFSAPFAGFLRDLCG
jgi:hypothetical protein